MPTDLPPDYKPPKPGEGKGAPPLPDGGGDDVKGHFPPGTNPGGKGGFPGGEGDVVDPTGWKSPGATDKDPTGVPTPAGTPTF